MKPALIAPGVSWSYAELDRRAAALAGTLRRGEPHPIELPPSPEFAVALRACALTGAVAAPIDPRLAPAERAARRAAVLPRAQNAAGGMPPRAAPAAVPLPDDAAMVVHTSGSTAAPKPVALTRANIAANTRGVAAALELTADDRWLCPLPLVHVGGLMVLWRCWALGATVDLQSFEAAACARSLQRDVTIASLVPTMLARVLDHGLRDPQRLRCVMLGGGPAAPALLERAAAAGVPVAQTYGLTEACSSVTVSEPGHAETAGRAIPGMTVTLADDGEILVAGAGVAPSAQPLLRTGDLGTLDDHGRLTVRGRKADTIVTGGENVAPHEVEAALLAHPAILDAAAFAVPDPEWGEALHAALVLRPGQDRPSDDELRAFTRDRLARFKVPKAFAWRETLPRTASGKLLRRDLA